MCLDFGIVSVVIPVYNAEQYIEKAVRSIAEQTYKNIEIILVDDCSLDNSSNLCLKLKNQYKNVIFFKHEKNYGQTITRNDGVRLSTGEWLMFLDADDNLPAYAIEKLVNRIRSDKTDIVFADYEIYDEENNRKAFSASLSDGVYTIDNFVSNIYNNNPLNVLTCIGSKLYNANFVKNVKDKTPSDVKTNYDMAFVVDALLAARKVSYIKEPLYEYFQRSNSITHSYRENMYSRINYARRRMKELLLKSGCFEEKRKFYYQMKYANIMWSLSQEVDFNRDNKHFKSVFDEIRNDQEGKEDINAIILYDNVIKHKVLMFLLKFNCCFIMRMLLKARKYNEECHE